MSETRTNSETGLKEIRQEGDTLWEILEDQDNG